MKYSLSNRSRWLSAISLLVTIWGFTQASLPHSPAPEIYVAGSPCDPVVRPLLSIPAAMDCEFIKWKLSLYKDPRNGSPTRFVLTYTYGMPKQGTRGFINGGTQEEKHGSWKLNSYSGSLPGKFQLLLYPQGQKSPIPFLKLDAHLLHLLDNEEKLMIGNAAWSYTLNKVSAE